MSQANPYQSPDIPAVSAADRHQSAVRATFGSGITLTILGIIGVFGSLYNLAFWVLVKFDKNPVISLDEHSDFMATENVIFAMVMLVQSALVLGGAISLFQRKRRWLAITGAWAGISPLCGCYLISLIAGIWILVVLRRPEVKALFAANQPSDRE